VGLLFAALRTFRKEGATIIINRSAFDPGICPVETVRQITGFVSPGKLFFSKRHSARNICYFGKPDAQEFRDIQAALARPAHALRIRFEAKPKD